jgi:hypothetical protein
MVATKNDRRFLKTANDVVELVGNFGVLTLNEVPVCLIGSHSEPDRRRHIENAWLNHE